MLPFSLRAFFARPLTLAVCAALALAGCDRQNQPPSQDNAAASGANAGAAVGAGGAVRYRVDRSGAGTALSAARLSGADGAETSLASLKGKPVLLNLWATWCAPCIEELPTLDAVAARLGSAAHVIALSQDMGEDDAPVRAFMRERGWQTIATWHDPTNEVGITYGGGLPTTVLFNAAGEEVLRVVGPMDWQGEEAQALLAEAGMGG